MLYTYCHLWSAWLYDNFPHYHISDTIFGKKIIEHKMSLLIFSKNFVRNISHPKKNSVGCYHKCTLSSSKVTIIIVRFSRKMDFLDRFSKKYSNIKFYGNPSSGSRVILYGQTNRRIDRHDETNRRFLQFCEHAKNETYFKSLPSVEKKELVHGGKGLGAVLELLRK